MKIKSVTVFPMQEVSNPNSNFYVQTEAGRRIMSKELLLEYISEEEIKKLLVDEPKEKEDD